MKAIDDRTPRFLAALLLLACGCVGADLSANWMPHADLDRSRTTYVVADESDEVSRGIAPLIAAALKDEGMEVTSGSEFELPPQAEQVVRYDCEWDWGPQRFLLDLQIDVYDRSSGRLIVRGHSRRPALDEAPPEDMVGEIVAKIFASRPAP